MIEEAAAHCCFRFIHAAGLLLPVDAGTAAQADSQQHAPIQEAGLLAAAAAATVGFSSPCAVVEQARSCRQGCHRGVRTVQKRREEAGKEVCRPLTLSLDVGAGADGEQDHDRE